MSTPASLPMSFTHSSAAQHPFPASQSADLPIVIRSRVTRRQSGLGYGKTTTAAAALCACAAFAFGAGIFVEQWWREHKTTAIKQRPVLRHAVSAEQRRGPRPGQGSEIKLVAAAKKPADREASSSKQKQIAKSQNNDEARKNLTQAIAAARKGAHDEATPLIRSAARALPAESEGLNLSLAYFEQYPGLADKARLALNGNSEVDLGPQLGRAQFVEQDSDSITFFARGKHERMTLEQFNELEGVRFRVTRDYLDRAASPVNDLILGASHFLLQIDDDGKADVTKARDAAQRRFQSAIRSMNRNFADEGTAMMKTLDFDKTK